MGPLSAPRMPAGQPQRQAAASAASSAHRVAVVSAPAPAAKTGAAGRRAVGGTTAAPAVLVPAQHRYQAVVPPSTACAADLVAGLCGVEQGGGSRSVARCTIDMIKLIDCTAMAQPADVDNTSQGVPLTPGAGRPPQPGQGCEVSAATAPVAAPLAHGWRHSPGAAGG